MLGADLPPERGRNVLARRCLAQASALQGDPQQHNQPASGLQGGTISGRARFEFFPLAQQRMRAPRLQGVQQVLGIQAAEFAPCDETDKPDF